MKTGFLFICTILMAACHLQASETGYEISVEINNLQNEDIILGYYYNKQMYVSDTAQTNHLGQAYFKGEEPLTGGLYLFYLPNGKYFDVLINKNQHFSIRTDTADLLGNMTISGAKDPELFLNYQRYLNQQQRKANSLREQLNSEETDPAIKEELNEQLRVVNQEVNHYWDEIIREHPETFLATFIQSMQEPSIPDFDIPENSVNPDSLKHIKRYHYYRNHYFDNIDFTDERLLRTPFFVQRLDNYFDRGIMQIPDTIARASIEIIEKSKPNERMFRFLVQYLFNKANESNIMGMDAVMVALAEKYYLSGEATWASETFLKNLQERVTAIKPTLIGNVARNLKMQDFQGNMHELHNIDANVTVVVFYEPSCGHCKKEIPDLYNNVYLPYKDKGVEVYAVYSLDDQQEWQEFIDEHQLVDWINVFDPYHQSRFRQFYDIRSTPMLYVLDKDKKIAGKRIDAAQLPGFIDHLLQRQGL